MQPIFDTTASGMHAAATGASSTIAPWLLDAALKGLLLTAVAWMAAACLQRRSAATLHRVWALCFAGCLLAPAISALAPTWGLKVVPAIVAPEVGTGSRSAALMGRQFQAPISAGRAGQDLTTIAPERPAPQAALPQEDRAPVQAAEHAQPNASNAAAANVDGSDKSREFNAAAWANPIVAAWALVALVIAARLAMHRGALARLIRSCDVLEQPAWQVALETASRRLDLPRRVQLLIHRDRVSPMTAGVVRPVIVLPAAARTWDASHRDSVLLHELAHVKRHDVLTQLVAGLAAAAYWFNPLCWIGLSQMRRYRELACDDLVLAGGQQPADYAGVLLGVAKSYRHRRLACAIGMARESNVERRIMAILDSARNRMPLSRRAAIGLLGAAAAVVALVGSMRLESRAEPAPPQTPPTAQAADGGNKNPTTDRGDEWTMEVLVTDEQDQPLAGSKVFMSVWSDDRDVRKKYPSRDFTADEHGVAQFKLPRHIRILRLWPSQKGYVPLFLNFAEGTHEDGKLIPDRYHFKLARGTKLSGMIVDEQGAPIPGVKVDVRVDVHEPAWGEHPDPMISTRLTDSDFNEGAAVTDDHGRWSIDNAPAKSSDTDFEFALMMEHDDYVRDSAWGELQVAQGVTTPMLRDGSARIVLPRGVAVAGTVVDQHGAPVSKGLVIWNDDPYLAAGVNETQIDDAGRFKTIPLSPREYPITVAAPGFQPEQHKVRVEPGMMPLDFTLKPGHRLAMKIVDPAGNAVPNAYVGLRDWRGTRALSNEDHPNIPDFGIPRHANNDGLYVWDWAPEDAVTYNVSATGFAPQDVTLIANADEHRVELAPKLAFSGQVTDARTGQPIPEFRVVPVTVFRPEFYSVQFDKSAMGRDGRYDIEIQLFGEQDYRYVMRVEARGYRSAMSETSFGVRDGAVKQDFALEPAPAREGVVVGPDGQPVEGAAVVFGTPSIVPMMENGELEWGGSGQKLKTSRDGKFEIAATWEPMRIRATHKLGFIEVLRAPNEPIGMLVLQPWAKLSGQVVQDGQPMAGQHMNFFPLPERDLGEARFQDAYPTQTDSQGRYAFDRLPPGAGMVRAYLGPWQESPLTSSESAAIDLKPGEQRNEVLGGDGTTVTGKVVATGRGDVPLDRNWSLNYLVSRDRGVELPEQLALGFDPAGPIDASSLDDPKFMNWVATRANYFVKLSPDGNLHVSGVPAGRYDLVLQLYEQPAGCLVQAVGKRVIPIDVTATDVAAGGKRIGDIEVPCRVGPRVGENMQVYKFVDPSGRERFLGDLKGRFVLMHVWASWCQPCMASMPELAATADELADQPVTFVGLNIDADADAARATAKRRGWNWSQNFLGDKSDMARQLAVSSAPAYFLIGPDGNLAASSADWSAIKAILEKSLQPANP